MSSFWSPTKKKAEEVFLKLPASYILPTSGGDLLCLATGFGTDASVLRVLWDGEAVPAEFVKTNVGLRLRVQIGAGSGGAFAFSSFIYLYRNRFLTPHPSLYFHYYYL